MNTITASISPTTTREALKFQTERPPSATPPPIPIRAPSTKPAADRVGARAYEIYQARNGSGTPGDHVSDWLQAERELSELQSVPAASAVELRSQQRGQRLLESGE